ncbi:hypothetical protein GEMRC1_007801 [Eukaryota sp. GEM-RC1]
MEASVESEILVMHTNFFDRQLTFTLKDSFEDTISLKGHGFTSSFASGTITGYDASFGLDVEIPSMLNNVNITVIDENAFKSKGIVSVVIPDTVLEIRQSAFESNSLQSVFIPNDVTIISPSAFANNLLESVSYGSGVTSIGTNAFAFNQLTTLDRPFLLETTGNNLKNVLSSFPTLLDGVTTIGDGAFQASNLTALVIPNSVITIGDSSFKNNLLDTLTLPNTAISLGESAFENNKIAHVTCRCNNRWRFRLP